jgi:hypothetical protein
MHPYIAEIFSMAIAMGVKKQFFMRKLNSKKMLLNKNFACTLEQQRGKMLMWLKKKTIGHVLWKQFPTHAAEVCAETCFENETLEVSNLFDIIKHGKNETKIFASVRNFVQAGNSVDEVCDDDGMHMSLLQAACLSRRTKTVLFLLKAGANVDLCDDNNETAIFYILRDSNKETEKRQQDTERHVQMMEMMWQHNANFKHQNSTGETVLHLLSVNTDCNMQAKKEILRIIKKCNDVELLKDMNETDALKKAVMNNMQEMIRLFISAYPLTYSIEYVMEILQTMTRENKRQNHIENTIKTLCTIDMNMMKCFCNFIVNTRAVQNNDAIS